MRVLVLSLHAKNLSLERLKATFGSRPDIQEIIEAQNEHEAKLAIQAGVDFIVACVGSGKSEQELGTVHRIREVTNRPILAVGPATDPKFIMRMIQVGADVFLDHADLESELKTALARVHIDENGADQEGRLLAVLSASGGCGASTLAVNIAAVLAKELGSCHLLDLNPGHGDLASLLDLKPQYTVADVCQNETRLDRPMFEKMLCWHADGIALLAAPSTFEETRMLTSRGVSQALHLGRTIFAQVVVDLEDCFHDEQSDVLEQASGILLIARLAYTSLRNARQVLDHTEKLGVRPERIEVVINNHGQPSEIPIDEAVNALGRPLRHFVPHDPKTINAANNSGIPAVTKGLTCKLHQAIAELAKIRFEKAVPRSGLLPHLKHFLKTIG